MANELKPVEGLETVRDCGVNGGPLLEKRDCIGAEYTNGLKTVSLQEIERLAAYLCDEFDFELNPVQGASWPEHENDEGKREGGYVRLQPSDVQAYARENAKRILTFLSKEADNTRSQAEAIISAKDRVIEKKDAHINLLKERLKESRQFTRDTLRNVRLVEETNNAALTNEIKRLKDALGKIYRQPSNRAHFIAVQALNNK